MVPTPTHLWWAVLSTMAYPNSTGNGDYANFYGSTAEVVVERILNGKTYYNNTNYGTAIMMA
jgi:hypothetical protein